MAGFGNIRKGRREAVDNLGFTEGGDCPRCGGEAQPSTMKGYLSCVACQHEWSDPDYVESSGSTHIPTYHQDQQKIEEFRKEVASGSLAGVLGVDKNLSKAQEALGPAIRAFTTGMQASNVANFYMTKNLSKAQEALGPVIQPGIAGMRRIAATEIDAASEETMKNAATRKCKIEDAADERLVNEDLVNALVRCKL